MRFGTSKGYKKNPAFLVYGNSRKLFSLIMRSRSDDKFVEDEGWHRAAERYNSFINENKSKNIVYLELGVGGNTPGIIKYPFWQLTAQNKNAVYACINLGESFCPDEIAGQSVCINADIGKVIEDLT